MAAPASVPGVSAWAVTVAPVVWGRPNVPAVAEVAALAGPALLALGASLERHFGSRIRSGYLGGFTVACAAAWVSAADTERGGPLLDGAHTVAGVFAWAMFALSWASAPLTAWEHLPRVAVRVPRPQAPFPRAAWASLAFGVSLAGLLQLVAFDAKSPERALLVRLLAVAGGLAAIGTSTKAALALYRRRRGPRL